MEEAAHRLERTVAAEAAGSRLDAWLAVAFPDLSRSRAKALILAGHVAVGGAKIVEPKRPVKPGEAVVLDMPPPEPAEPEGEDIPLVVVYEDDDLIVIDKPPGLVVHPAAGNHAGTLVNALIAHCGASLSGIGGVMRPGIVHRLDKDTSGLMVVAKNDRAHKRLAAQFADHGRTGPLQRAYLAIVWGAPQQVTGTIVANLARSARNREKMAIVRAGGREAITHWERREVYGPAGRPVAAAVECQLETGRTHQIRVHMASIGHPVIGDRAYGSGFLTKATSLPEPARSTVEAFPRQALHAWLLGFAHPVTGEEMTFEAEPPPDMLALMAALEALGK